MDIYKLLKGLEPDDKGRLIHQIWDFSDTEIEALMTLSKDYFH